MRIHADKLTEQDIRDAAKIAGAGVYRLGRHGSRSRDHAFDVIIEGSGRTGTRYGQNAEMIAATWDEWGIALAEMFRRDDSITIPPYYHDVEHFHWATTDRFRTLTAADQCIRHRWVPQGRSAGGAYAVSDCPKCGAHQRWELRKGAWFTEINNAQHPGSGCLSGLTARH